ncbi:hypothetical protein P4R38_00545 [Luteipulveratus sp. YIM 133296]|uniref:Uncharacterized protein n=1 Tax=Luteipulveratus flavus TaxID=3031728 RepID=A0ABT6C285_9MICO|nr:hypothetical protein [Luteipulveratus sp. YIM 133296]MDF8262731.1 hypothetical protein [Luteipulveratus sp. YIM 133296]
MPRGSRIARTVSPSTRAGLSSYASSAFQKGRTASMSAASMPISTVAAARGCETTDAPIASSLIVLASSTSRSVTQLTSWLVVTMCTVPGWRTSIAGWWSMASAAAATRPAKAPASV